MLVKTSKLSRPLRLALRFYMGQGPLKRLRRIPLWVICRAMEFEHRLSR
mgnify:CR=1 FL=1|jgi:hypothetical protein